MKKNLLTIAAGLVVVFCILTLYRIYHPHEIQKEIKRDAIVRLVAEDGSTFCTGTVLTDTAVLTAGHCLLEQTFIGTQVKSEKIGIRERDNKELHVYGLVAGIFPQMDTGIIVGDFKKFDHQAFTTKFKEILELRNKKDDLLACGYPLNGDLVCTILKYQEQDDFDWSVSGTLIPGMSGGPVMTVDGVVIAINQGVKGPNAVIAPIYNIDTMFKGK
jgi:hypothetical protein